MSLVMKLEVLNPLDQDYLSTTCWTDIFVLLKGFLVSTFRTFGVVLKLVAHGLRDMV